MWLTIVASTCRRKKGTKGNFMSRIAIQVVETCTSVTKLTSHIRRQIGFRSSEMAYFSGADLPSPQSRIASPPGSAPGAAYSEW